MAKTPRAADDEPAEAPTDQQAPKRGLHRCSETAYHVRSWHDLPGSSRETGFRTHVPKPPTALASILTLVIVAFLKAASNWIACATDVVQFCLGQGSLHGLPRVHRFLFCVMACATVASGVRHQSSRSLSLSNRTHCETFQVALHGQLHGPRKPAARSKV
jgi:hypothetical protein